MRPVAIIIGILITLCGVVAIITGEFSGLGSWVMVLGFGAVGLAGLASVLLGNRVDGEPV